MNDLIVNLHLLEQCNFRCLHCFSHFGSPDPLGFSGWKKIVSNILESNCVRRVNLAGGEPLLLPWIWELADYIRQNGAEVSIITNGSLLRNNMLQAKRISMIGISIDSFNTETLTKMGRCTEKGMPLSGEQYRRLCALVKNRGIDLKINTVVTKLNLEDSFSILKEIMPIRWKILRMQTFKTENFSNSHLAVSDEEFAAFCKRQDALGIPFVPENTMRNTYIFIDPLGRLINNAGGKYASLGNLLEENFLQCFERLPLDKESYENRYKNFEGTQRSVI